MYGVDFLFEQLQNENEQLKLQNENLRNNNFSNTNNINSNNTNNISINVYGSEDMSHITDAMYKSCFRQMQRSVEKLFNMKHFSNQMMENQNIYITNFL